MTGSRPTVGALVAAVDRFAPFAHAESWDNVGLAVGDPDFDVHGVLVTLDPTLEAIERALQLGANCLVTHHPAFLGQLDSVVADRKASAAVFRAAAGHINLIAAHTNLDRHPRAGASLCERLGFSPESQLETGLRDMGRITVYVPATHAQRVREAMHQAGAGVLDQYRDVSFAYAGTGRFTPQEGAEPAIGSIGAGESVAEECVEMVCDVETVGRVLDAVRRVHPYESPVAFSDTIVSDRGKWRMGAISSLDEPLRLSEIAERVYRTCGSMPRVWGSRSSMAERVAFATGSGSSLVADAISVGCDVLVAGEVRYHDAMDAVGEGLSVVEIGHDVSEWPLVPLLAEGVLLTPGIRSDSVHIDPPSTRWWTP